jgi:hypothetical protein
MNNPTTRPLDKRVHLSFLEASEVAPALDRAGASADQARQMLNVGGQLAQRPSRVSRATGGGVQSGP